MKLPRKTHVKEYFISLKIMTVYGMYIYQTIIHFKEREHTLKPLGSTHEYNTRNRNNIAIPIHNLELFKKKPTYAGALFFSKLPLTLRQEPNPRILKRKLKDFITTKALYNIQEFLDPEFNSKPSGT